MILRMHGLPATTTAYKTEAFWEVFCRRQVCGRVDHKRYHVEDRRHQALVRV